jgi:ABC-type multidrug transport system ATPase subunit
LEICARSLSLSFPEPGRFGLRLRRRTAVRDVSFEVAAGEVVALVGRNGAGKSTTLRLLAGILPPDAGTALLGGVPAARAEARRRLGYLPEEDAFPGGLRVGDILRYAAVLAGYRGGRVRREVERAAEAASLGAWLAIRGSHCSRGMRRRVSLAQALLGEPRALVLDEPLGGLDPEIRARSCESIRRAAEGGAAVVLSLHEASVIESLADRVIVLADGAVAADAPLGELAPGAGKGGAACTAGADWLAATLRDADGSVR